MGSNYIFQNKNPARRVSLFYIFFCKMLLLLLFSHCFVLFWLCPIVLWPYGLYSLPGSSVRGISLALKLEWGAFLFSRGSSQPRDQTWVSYIGRQIFYCWATREAQMCLRMHAKDSIFLPCIVDCNYKLKSNLTKRSIRKSHVPLGGRWSNTDTDL